MSFVSLTNSGGSLTVNPSIGVQQINLNDYDYLLDTSDNSINVPVSAGTTNILNNDLPYIYYDTLLGGVDGSVNAITFDANGNLYVGGSFTTAGGIPANNVAKWDGSSWSAVGGGLNGTVYALIIGDSDNQLYAGGDFSGNLAYVSNITSLWTIQYTFDGEPIMDGPVYCFAFDALTDILYFGGDFTVPYTNIAAHKYGIGSINKGNANGVVRSLTITVVNGIRSLIAGGDFTVIGSNLEPSSYIARNSLQLDGPSDFQVRWYDLSANLNGPVYSLISDSGLIYAGGNFTSPITRVGLFNISSATWTAFGSGVNATVKAFTRDGSGNVFVGGDFTAAGGTTANYIAKWDGVEWSASLGNGTNAPVNALGFINNSLYIGGEFTEGNGDPVNYIAEIENTTGILGDVDVSVNSKFLFSLIENQKINVFVTSTGVPYTNGLLI